MVEANIRFLKHETHFLTRFQLKNLPVVRLIYRAQIAVPRPQYGLANLIVLQLQEVDSFVGHLNTENRQKIPIISNENSTHNSSDEKEDSN